nr:copper transporter [Nocardioides houyundeii]
MISFRTHVVTLVSVFLALAVGVVLGGGPLGEVGRDGDTDAEVTQLRAAAQRSEQQSDFGDRFAETAATSLYAGRLAEREVAVVTLPGADEQVVSALVEQVAAAGGSVVTTQALGDPMVSSQQKSLVDTLGSQLAAQLPKETVAAEATTYERMGQLLGFSLSTKAPEGAGTTSQTLAVLEGMRGADLLPEVPATERRAPLVLVVLGEEVDGDGGDDILAGLVRGLGQAALGVVVAGESSDGKDQLAGLRADGALGTAASVDGVETPAGQVATVVGLARSLTTQGGAFGASGADGALPLG